MTRPLFIVLALAVNAISPMLTHGDDRTTDPDCRLVDIPKCQIHIVDRALIAAERDGILDSIPVKVGQVVEKGAELAHLRDAIARTSLDLARAKASSDVNVRYAREVLLTSKEEYDQSLKLVQSGATTSTEARRKKLDYERGTLSLEQSEFEFKLSGLEAEVSQAEWQAYHVQAPFSGTIRQVLKTPGESVQDGQPIVELVNTDRVQVEGYGLLEELWDVQPGVEVEVWLDAPELERFGVTKERFRGRLIHVDSLVQPVTGKVRVLAEVDNRRNILRDGLRANMQIRVLLKPGTQAASATSAPATARP
jgi:RND family efflux transporter MFP subunit